MTRSSTLAAEIRTMDGIERAMGKIDDLPEPSQARVRRWVAETYLDGTAGGGTTFGDVASAAGGDKAKLPGRPVPDNPQA